MRSCGIVVAVILLAAGVSGCISAGTMDEAMEAWRAEVAVMKAAVEKGQLEAKVAGARLEAEANAGDAEAAEILARAIALLKAKDTEIFEKVKANEGKMEAAVAALAGETATIVEGITLMKDAIANPGDNSFLGLPVDSNKLATGALLAIFGNIWLAERRKKKRDENGLIAAPPPG